MNVTDPVGNKTTFVYDAANRLTQQTDPLGHSSTYSYDLANRLTSTTDRDGRRIDNTYDSDNRLTVTGTDPSAADPTASTASAGKAAGTCVMNCDNQQGDIYSFHSGGANVALADGSVRFVKASIAINILAALVTKGGGEVVGPNDY